MIKRLTFTLLLILLSIRAVSAQQNPLAPDWLADPQLHVTALPDLLNADSTPTALGDLRMLLDSDNHQLLYQYDEQPVQSIPFPPEFQGHDNYVTHRITIAPDGRTAEICDVEIYGSFTGINFAVDLSQHQITPSGSCQVENWWDLTGRGIRDALSPDTRYRVSAPDNSPLCGSDLVILIESKDEKRVGACIKRNPPDTTIQFVRWLDDDRLLLRTYSTIDGNGPLEESLVLSVSTGKLTSLGDEISYSVSGASLFFYDNHHKAVRIAHMASAADKNLEGFSNCTLNLIDFDTEQSVDIEPTFCLRQPHILINEQKQELFYLNVHLLNPDELWSAQVIPHFVKLDTHEISVVPVKGVDFFDLSPDWEHLQFTTDRDPGSSMNYIWYAGDPSSIYVNLHFVVYDRGLNRVVYDRPLRPVERQNLEALTMNDRPPPFGVFGFEWTLEGWRTVIRVDGESPSVMQSANGEIHETALPNVPPDNVYNASWSPDRQKVLISFIGPSIYVVDLRNGSSTQILKPTDQIVNTDWNTDDQLLISTNYYDNNYQLVVKRWLVDLPV